jgi:hypothetical protein
VVHGVGAMVQMNLVIEYQPLWSLWRQVMVSCPAEASEEVAHLMAQYAPSKRKRPPPVRTKRKRPPLARRGRSQSP